MKKGYQLDLKEGGRVRRAESAVTSGRLATRKNVGDHGDMQPVALGVKIVSVWMSVVYG